jgi:hypothetical protein
MAHGQGDEDVLDTDCVDGNGRVWPEHDYSHNGTCTRCDAKVDDDHEEEE